MRRSFAILMVVGASLVTSGEAAAKPHNSQEKQEQCEMLCVQCLAAGASDGSLCVKMSQWCCKHNGGNSYGTCGCRTEMSCE
jgi:uncharacterized membrane-anchored protein